MKWYGEAKRREKYKEKNHCNCLNTKEVELLEEEDIVNQHDESPTKRRTIISDNARGDYSGNIKLSTYLIIN